MRVLSSTLYKYTTFSCEIQIGLTFRNIPRNVKKQRFAADRVGHVLYYEAVYSGVRNVPHLACQGVRMKCPGMAPERKVGQRRAYSLNQSADFSESKAPVGLIDGV